MSPCAPCTILTLATLAAAGSGQTSLGQSLEPDLGPPRRQTASPDPDAPPAPPYRPKPALHADLRPERVVEALPRLAQEAAPFDGPKSGFFVKAMLPYQAIGGDFDGDSALVGPGVGLVIPEVDPGFGFGLGLGIRREHLSLELSYQRTSHDSSFLGVPFDVTLESINLDFKGYFLAKSRVQPSILLGLAFPWLKVENGAFDSSGFVGDAKFSGIGANLGTGVTFYPISRVGISLDAGYRFTLFENAKGGGVSGEIDDSLDASGLFVTLGTTFTF